MEDGPVGVGMQTGMEMEMEMETQIAMEDGDGNGDGVGDCDGDGFKPFQIMHPVQWFTMSMDRRDRYGPSLIVH